MSNLETNTAIAPATSNWSTLGPLEECRAKLHKTAFRVSHGLTTHPLFQLETLVGVAKEAARRGRGDLYFDAGDVTLSDKWGQIAVPDLSAIEIIRRIETANAWIAMKHVDVNPKYKTVLDDCTEFVRTVAGSDAAKLLINPEMVVFITSPLRVTPYHIDAVANFLVQIHGSKDIWICDPLDRSVTTEDEIERYYAGDMNAGIYKPRAEQVATKFVLHPGDAIHIPSHAAHWVKNHDNTSVSLSLNFEFPRWMKMDVYLANHYLRRLGLSPRPPGRSIMVDRSKAAVIETHRFLKRLFRRK